MMLVLLLCIIMKVAELSMHKSFSLVGPPEQPACKCNNRKRSKCNRQIKKLNNKRSNKAVSTMEEPQTPGSDCNSNPATDPIVQDLINSEFIQDNSEYQWFIDYNYRDGGLHVHPSVLSSLSASYTQDDLGYYDDLARNLDANLAEVDMENFRTSDIHTLLSTLPAAYTDQQQRSEGEDSACSTTDTISICKSSLLFSPVKETPVLPPGGSYSVDSLDCEDMLLTCQTNNKNNYTIAFEGSVAMYPDGSQDFDGHDKQKKYEALNYDKALEMANMLDLSMACSDSKIYTTWSNLKHTSINKTMSRHPSGNNNTISNLSQSTGSGAALRKVKRSQSLPDLAKKQQVDQIVIPLNFSVDLVESSNPTSQGSNSVTDSNTESNSSSKKMHNLSLVKLFMKQKSMSIEGMSLTQSDSDGWPVSCSDSSSNTNTQIPNQKHPFANDFSINWLKPEDNQQALQHSTEKTPKTNSPTMNKFSDQIMDSSLSIEELTETSRSTFDPALSHKKSWNGFLEKVATLTTGTQARVEVEDNAVQTSLIYDVDKARSPIFKETFMDRKPVYVVYPNYALPDLSFINATRNKFENVALKPQNLNRQNLLWKRVSKGRPFSCNDIDSLRQRGFAHIKDWESLTFLLPSEYKKILHDVPELSKHVKLGEEIKKPLFCLSPPTQYRRRNLSDYVPNNVSSSSSTTTQPSSGYRGSSTILSDSSSTNQQISNNTANPLYLYRYDSISSETAFTGQDKTRNKSQDKAAHPPLPRSILRKNKAAAGKRYSMFEMGEVNEVEDKPLSASKQTSLQELYCLNNDHLVRQIHEDSDKDVDEVEEKIRAGLQLGQSENEPLDSSEEDIRQLEEFMKRSGISSSSDADDENSEMKLRSCVRRFLNLRMNRDICKTIDLVDSQKKTVSFAMNQNRNKESSEQDKLNRMESFTQTKLSDMDVKRKEMIWSVNKAVNILLKYWHTEPAHDRPSYSETNECAQLCISNLCPALYAIMSDGLKPYLESTFGPITNSVWQVVEASSQQGPLTKTLNDLVQKINGEDFMTEGMLKFHAFIFGLLNLKALDAWFAYLCTRESILRKHYNGGSLFVSALACVNTRDVVDTLLETLHPLSLCPFQLDLLYQYKQLHNSFGNTNHVVNFRTMESPKKERSERHPPSPRKTRVRNSYIPSTTHDLQEVDGVVKKRWSTNLPLSVKMFGAFEKRLDDSEDYTDSLEHTPARPTDPVHGEIKFRKLQQKWESIGSGRDEAKDQNLSPVSPSRIPCKSKIPRPLTSPVKSCAQKSTRSPVSGIPSLRKPAAPPTAPKVHPRNNKDVIPRRTSRVDQDVPTTKTHLTRPSSLPYKGYGNSVVEKNSASNHRRAASTSLPRPNSTITPRSVPQKQTPKFVRTLTHRSASNNGHLSFNEGDKLKIILEVDSKWLLCARGELKGLVPRSCVHFVQT